MRFLLDKFNGNVPSALAGYNAGEGAVEKYGLRRVRRFSNFPKGDARRGSYTGSTGEYIDRITSGYTGFGYHPNRIKLNALVRPKPQDDASDLFDTPQPKTVGRRVDAEKLPAASDDVSDLFDAEGQGRDTFGLYNANGEQRVDDLFDAAPGAAPDTDTQAARSPHALYPDKFAFPNTSVRIPEGEAVDLTDGLGNPLSVRPIDAPQLLDKSVGEQIAGGAKYFGATRESVPDNPSRGLEIAGNLTVKLPGDERRHPTDEEITAAAISAFGADAVRANDLYRNETGRYLANFEPEEIAQIRKSLVFDPQSRTYEFVMPDSPALRRGAAAYLSGGLQGLQDEYARVQMEDRAEKERLAEEEKATRTFGDTVRAGLSDAGLAEAQLAQNASIAARAAVSQDRNGADYQRLQQEEGRGQAAIDDARRAIPEEKGPVRKIVRGVVGGLAEAPMYLAAGEGAPVLAFAQNLNRGLPAATGAGLETAATMGVGKAVSGLTGNLSPLARQAAGRAAMAATNAGQAALFGERDPSKLLSAAALGAAFPVGRNRESTPSSRSPFGDALARALNPTALDGLLAGETNYVRYGKGEQVPSVPKGYSKTRVRDGSYVVHPESVTPETIRGYARENLLEVLNMTDVDGEPIAPGLNRYRQVKSEVENSGKLNGRRLRRKFKLSDEEVGDYLNRMEAEGLIEYDKSGYKVVDPRKRPGLVRNVLDTLGVFKSAQSSGDVSGLLRQGLMFISEPRAWYRGMKRGLASLNSDTYADVVDDIATHPMKQTAEESGLFLATQGKGREESFPSRFASKLPVVKQSEQSYNATLDTMRLETFSKYAEILQSEGVTPETNPKAYRDLARRINSMSGRGDLGRLNPAAELLNVPFFSPRLIKARFDVLNPIEYMRMDPRVRKIALKQTAKVIGAITSTLMLASAAGLEVGTDPEKSTFLKIKSGEMAFDITGGNARYLRVGFRLARYIARLPFDGVNFKEDGGAALTEARKNFAPIPSYITDAATGEDVTGRAFSLKRNTIELITPLFLKDVYEAFEEEGLTGAAKALPSAVGVGVETRGKSLDELQGRTEQGEPEEWRVRLKEKVDADPELKAIAGELHDLDIKVGRARRDKGESDESYQARLERQEPKIQAALTELITGEAYQLMTDVEKQEAIRRRVAEVRRADDELGAPEESEPGVEDLFENQ
jgi:hypothetical protein